MFSKMQQVSLRSTINHIVCDFNLNNCEKDEDDFSWSEIVSKCLQGRQQQMLGQIPEISMSEASSVMLPPDDLFETEVGRENISFSLINEVNLQSPKLLRASIQDPPTVNPQMEMDNPVVTNDNIDPVIESNSYSPLARVSTPSNTRLTTLIEKVANTPDKITTSKGSLSGISSARVSTSSTNLETTLTPTKISTSKGSLSGISSARVSTSPTNLETTLTPTKISTSKGSLSSISSTRVSTSPTNLATTLTPTKISTSSRPKRFLKNKRIQTWRGERPIYVPLENGCYKIIGTSAPHTPDFMKRKKRVTLKRKKVIEPKEKEPDDQIDVSETFVEKSETTREKLSKIFLNRENLNWKKLKVHKNLEHATLIKSKEAKQIVGYFRFIEKCNKPVNKTGQYLSLYILMEGSITIKIEDEPPVLIKKSDPVIIPPETNYSMENMIDGESILLFCIL